MQPIVMHPIGIVRSPYREGRDIPIQGRFKADVEARVELKREYAGGLTDLDGFSHAILLYHFHKSRREDIEGTPFLEGERHGIFAIRSPHRPNHIGLSVVKIKSVCDNVLYFTEVDVLDGTPVLDIKPYVSHFDSRPAAVCGWLDKHFKNGGIPDGTVIR
jgi:tRNA-Thr(GGU) m(6)t(6)A37 methyltransferase TsaA